MEIRTGGRNHGKQRELIDRMCKEIADLRFQNRAQSTRIRELEGLLDKTVNLLLKMPDEINDFELIEEAENALNKTKWSKTMTDIPKSPREAYLIGKDEGRKEAEKTLRDEIAMRAMQGMIVEYNLDRKIPGSTLTEKDVLVQRAYEIADAMLKARSETEGEG